jgi:tetratricopeptide (TPR) repeat protein
VNAGLQIPPADPVLQALQGVLLEGLGQTDQAAQAFVKSKTGFQDPVEFYLARGQDYVEMNQPEKAMADAQSAIQADPASGAAYLLLGQAGEMQQNFQGAMDAYNKAYEVADSAKQPELAALARMRIAMLMQTMNSRMAPELLATPTP